MNVRTIDSCRSCDSGRLDRILDLGVHCISDFVDAGATDCDTAPLVLVRCHDCGLVQLEHTVPRERLYGGDYHYRSGTNEMMVAALADVVKDALSYVETKPGDTVIDIGSNDGTLLQQYGTISGLWRFGYEPSNVEWTRPRDARTSIIRDFYPSSAITPHDKAKIISSIACFYDLDDPNAFVAAIKRDLHPDGVWVVQMADLGLMLEKNAFDNICHEHLEYYDATTFSRLIRQHGLAIAHIGYNSVNGGSLRAIICHQGRSITVRPGRHFGPPTGDVSAFATRIERLKGQTVAYLTRLKQEGRRVVGYGASTKGNTLLQYYGIGPDLLPCIADRSPFKWGKVTVGTNIPIISEDDMRANRPDYLFALPWHFIDAFIEREKDLLAQGTKFIVPLPKMGLVGAEYADIQPALPT